MILKFISGYGAKNILIKFLIFLATMVWIPFELGGDSGLRNPWGMEMKGSVSWHNPIPSTIFYLRFGSIHNFSLKISLGF